MLRLYSQGIAFDDPYAMAVMVALLQKEFDVVRVKNRFENDEVQEVSAETIQAEFYAAETLGEDASSTNESAAKSQKMYRDILVNLRPKGSDFICEVQLTLTGVSILKKSEQKIYSLARMTSAQELVDTFVFSEHDELARGLSRITQPAVGALARLAVQPDSLGDVFGVSFLLSWMSFNLYPQVKPAVHCSSCPLCKH